MKITNMCEFLELCICALLVNQLMFINIWNLYTMTIESYDVSLRMEVLH
uniref:Uncharacterized protein n=1 Tax=Picea sitchensis TaxID=3332 RepID=A9NXL0_PICSI|nr:unknown [Picea sitchensis]